LKEGEKFEKHLFYWLVFTKEVKDTCRINIAVHFLLSKHKQNWTNHPERMDNTRLPKHALNYKPRRRSDRGRLRKRWQRVNAGTGQTT
jgi:hypothetical protein